MRKADLQKFEIIKSLWKIVKLANNTDIAAADLSEERISVVPSKDDVEAFFKPSKFSQIEMNFDEKGESENEEHADD